MINIIHVIIIITIIYLSYEKAKAQVLYKFFLPAIIYKMLAGISVGLLYFYYYGYGDTILYFNDASEVSDLFYYNWKSYFLFLLDIDSTHLHYEDNYRALFFVKLISPIVVLTYKNYWITSAYLSLLSFFSCWYLVKNINKYYPRLVIGAIVALLFVPSIVFWSSGIMKESISMTLIAMLSSYFIQLINDDFKEPVSKVIFGILFSFLLFQLKYYYAAVFLLSIFPTIILKLILWRIEIKYKVISWLILLIFAIIGVSFLHPNLDLQHLVDVTISNNKLYNHHIGLDKTIHYYHLENNIWSVLINAPWAIVSALFRPFIFEAGSILQFMLGIENMFVLATLLFFPFRIIKKVKVELPVLLTCFTYIIVLCIFLALSTPNFGTLSRYRISFLPFFIILISYKNPLIEKLANLKLRIGIRKT